MAPTAVIKLRSTVKTQQKSTKKIKHIFINLTDAGPPRSVVVCLTQGVLQQQKVQIKHECFGVYLTYLILYVSILSNYIRLVIQNTPKNET